MPPARNKPRGRTVRLLEGPHNGRRLVYPSPLPRVIVMLDRDLCYHEYLQQRDLAGVYRWTGALGIPDWAKALGEKGL